MQHHTFLEENKKQALGERRVGLGVMGLHDLLIYCETEYGSEEGNKLLIKYLKQLQQPLTVHLLNWRKKKEASHS